MAVRYVAFTALFMASIVLALPVGSEETAAFQPNPFFAFKNSMEGQGPDSVEEQVQILKDLGFDGFEIRELEDIEASVQALEAQGLKLFTSYFKVNIDPGETPYNPRLTEVLPLLKGHETILWCNTHSSRFSPSDPAGNEFAVPLFQELADLAAPYGVRIAPYPHINFWVETAGDSARLAEKVQRDNFGTSFNLYHWKVRGDKEPPFEEVVRRVAPRLMVISINGDEGPSNIGPLEEKQIDEYYSVLKAFRDAGFRGPVGLQCYRVPGDPQKHLAQSMAVWKALNARIEMGTP
jgi:sugar phosphate isomerase/epimerase